MCLIINVQLFPDFGKELDRSKDTYSCMRRNNSEVFLQEISRNIYRSSKFLNCQLTAKFVKLAFIVLLNNYALLRHEYSTEANKKLISFNSHKKACRDLFFSLDGTSKFLVNIIFHKHSKVQRSILTFKRLVVFTRRLSCLRKTAVFS